MQQYQGPYVLVGLTSLGSKKWVLKKVEKLRGASVRELEEGGQDENN